MFKNGPWPYRIPKLWQVEPTMEVFQELMHVAAEAPFGQTMTLRHWQPQKKDRLEK